MRSKAAEDTSTGSAYGTERTGWYELRPFFEQVDDKYADMYEILKRIREFSFFIVRNAGGTMQIFVHVPDGSDADVAQGLLKNALMEPTEPKVFSAGEVAYLKMRKHYAIPVAHELAPPLLYATMEKIGRPCFVAVTAKHSTSLTRYRNLWKGIRTTSHRCSAVSLTCSSLVIVQRIQRNAYRHKS